MCGKPPYIKLNVHCTHVKHEKNINESRRENIQNERKLRRKTKVTAQHSSIIIECTYVPCMDLYDLDNVQNKVFVGYVGRIYFICSQQCIQIHYQASQQFPAKICRKTYKLQ